MDGKVTIEIALGNAAMSDAADVANALRILAAKLDSRGFDYFPIMDLNGNKVGEFNVEKDGE